MSYILPAILIGMKAAVSLSITGFDGIQGNIRIALYDSGEYFPENSEYAFLTLSEPVTDDTLTVVLNDIPFGTWAVSVHHDKNSNGELDRNFLGIPSERVGFSSGARATRSAPDFDNASFSLNTESLLLFIELH